MLARLADLLEEQAPAIYKKWIAKARVKEYTNGTIIHAAVWPTLLAALRTEDLGSFRRRLHDVIHEKVMAGTVTWQQFMDETQGQFEVIVNELMSHWQGGKAELASLWHALSRLQAEASFAFSESFLKAGCRKSAEAVRSDPLQQENREIKALQETIAAIQSPLDLSEVLNKIVNGVVDGMGYLTALLAVVDEQTNILQGRAIAVKECQGRMGARLVNQDVAEGAVPLSQRDNLAVQSALAGQTVVATRLHDVFRPPGTTADLRRVAKTCRYPRHCLDPPYGPRAPDGRTTGWLFQGRNLTARVDVSSGLRPAGRHSHRKSAVPSRDRAPVDRGNGALLPGQSDYPQLGTGVRTGNHRGGLANSHFYTRREAGLVLAKRRTSDVVVQVIDPGIGIPKKAQRNLFSKFF